MAHTRNAAATELGTSTSSHDLLASLAAKMRKSTSPKNTRTTTGTESSVRVCFLI